MALPKYNAVLLRMEKRTTRFVIGAILMMTVLLVLIAIKHEYFSRSTSLYFSTSDAQGLSKGMGVKFIGFKVGSVESVTMQPNATVKVQMSINNDYLHFIGQDAKARLIKEGLVGEGVVEIVQGDVKSRRIEPNDSLEFERGQDVGKIAENLADQVEPILSDIKQITGSVNNPNGGIKEIIKNVNQATKAMGETSEQLALLAKGGNQKADAIYVKLDRALDKVNGSLETLDKSLPGLMTKADSTLENVQGVSADIRKISAESSNQVPELVRNANALAQDGKDVINGAKKSWLLQGLFPAPEEQMLPADSYVRPAEKK